MKKICYHQPPQKEMIKNILQKITSDKRLEIKEGIKATKIGNKGESKE